MLSLLAKPARWDRDIFGTHAANSAESRWCWSRGKTTLSERFGDGADQTELGDTGRYIWKFREVTAKAPCVLLLPVF
jgi:hypothetical protein